MPVETERPLRDRNPWEDSAMQPLDVANLTVAYLRPGGAERIVRGAG
jgi:hypothetical protein